MAFSYSYNPIVSNPHLRKDMYSPMVSNNFKTPFLFGGSQVPDVLYLAKHSYNGSSGNGFHKGTPSKTHPNTLDFTFRKGSHSRTHVGDLDFSSKKGDVVHHIGGHYVKEMKNPFGEGFHKGSQSITHSGDMDFTTKHGDFVFHRKGHNVKIPHTLPFRKHL
jgi:hypothetical protein